jgi:FKBP-type peptidyl-prolyl cis-trans isomerase FkpA
MKRLLLVVAAVSLAACDLNTQPEDHPTDPATETFASALNVAISTMQKATSDTRCASDPHYCVYYKDISVGTGTTLTTATSIEMSYGEFVKSGAIAAQGTHAIIVVTSIPPGLQQGMSGMKIGGERLIVIPSALGYGNNSVGTVPPNSTLLFDVLLYSFQ